MSATILRLDYATMNFDAGTVDDAIIGRKLAGDSSVLCWRALGTYENAPLYSPLGLRYVSNNGWAARPHKLECSGVGCRKFLYTLPGLRDPETQHFSRLDFAFDVIMNRDDWKVFLGNCFISSMESDRERKRYKLAGDGEAMTVYIGSRRSAKYFRIYNKTLQDKEYRYLDPAGNEIELAEDQCVIRYEVELHRWKSVSKQGLRVFDPSPAFDWYYSSDPADHEKLHREIRALWDSFGNDILLPVDWDELEFVDLTDTASNKNFVQNSTEEEKLEEVKEELHDFPHSFDHTIEFICSRYGKYIPYILMSDRLRKECWYASEIAFGFAPSYIFEPNEPVGYYDMEDIEDSDLPSEWFDTPTQLSIESQNEGG